MNDAASLARNRQAAATSAGVPIRPSGTVAATLPVTGTGSGTLHAVVAGIQDFPRRPDRRLTYAASDARLIADTLARDAAPLFDTLDIQVLTKPEETDRAHITQALTAMQSSVGPDDEFLFYVASHGIVVAGKYHLITSDVAATDRAGLEAEAIGSAELSSLLANIPAARKLVIIDTCDAGAVGGALTLANGGVSARTAVTILGRDIGLTVLAATNSDQEALEGGLKEHGLFSWVVAGGLAGKAADPESGIVSSARLADYVEAEVPQLADYLYRRRQQPTITKSGQSFSVTKVR